MTQTLAVLFLVSPLQVEKTKRKEASQTASGGQHQESEESPLLCSTFSDEAREKEPE